MGQKKQDCEEGNHPGEYCGFVIADRWNLPINNDQLVTVNIMHIRLIPLCKFVKQKMSKK